MVGRFLFLRHGETDWNKLRLCVGKQDRALTANGREQARSIQEVIRAYRPTTVFTSPLQRARETTQIVLEGWDCDVIVQDGLAEVCFGELEGRPEDEADDFVSRWLAGHAFKVAETYALFQERVVQAFHLVTTLPAESRPLVVAHWAVHHALLSALDVVPCDIGHCRPMLYRNGLMGWETATLDETCRDR